MKTDDIFGKFSNGTIDVLVEENPDLKSNDGEFLWLDISFYYDDFDAIYIDALRSKNLPIAVPEDDDCESDSYEKNQVAFNKEFSDFQILGSFDYMYKDYVFGKAQIQALSNECLEIKTVIKSEDADRAIRKMIYSCEKAIETGFYLTFRCD